MTEEKNPLQWTEHLLAIGRHAFTLNEVKEVFSSRSDEAIKLSLNRLSKKGKILSIHQGYYIIVPPQYARRGILPPDHFVDGLMRYLSRPYYVGLLSAAALHGAAHQQPQEYFVVTNFPAMRPTEKKNIKINYISKKEIEDSLLEQRKTATGYLRVSSPELTATDLIQFEERVGGLNRAATVISELAEEVKPDRLSTDFVEAVPVTVVQRLGFLLDVVLEERTLADRLYEVGQQAELTFYRIPLKPSQAVKGYSSDPRWKVIVNTEIEIDE
jgi:predicted transcriptional regulator of viral defense system